MHAFAPPRTFDELMAVQHLAAMNVTGADHSSYNGQWKGQPSKTVDGERVLGTAEWDGTVLYDEEYVVKPLRMMFLRSGQDSDDRTLLQFRNAIDVVFHENLHFLTAAGTEHRDGERAYKYAPVRALEEGATSEYVAEKLDDYIRALELHKIAPRIDMLPSTTAYPRFSPATEQLAWELAQLSVPGESGLEKQEVLRRLNVVNAADKWSVATGLIVRSHRLHELFRGDDRLGQAERQIEQAMWNEFYTLATLNRSPAHTLFSRSTGVGRRAFEAGLKKAGEWHIRTLSLGGLPPLVPRGYEPAEDVIGPYRATTTRNQRER
jgi:hypothetical protein